jgi:3-oxoacyl-[acyl-carrier protein] reductase
MRVPLKNVVVTGAAAGLGYAVANALVDLGVSVACLDANEAMLAEGVKKLTAKGGKVTGRKLDVSDPVAVAKCFESVVAANGPVDGLVTCAGIQSTTRILDLTIDEWDRVININLRGTFLCVQQALKSMIPKEFGRIVTIASDTAKRGGGRLGKSAYGASKGGVLLFTRSIARELGSLNGRVRVNCLCPGPMFTKMHDGMTPDIKQMVEGSVPLGRFGTPEEIANGALFLLSDEASFVYGESMMVDGGVVMD